MIHDRQQIEREVRSYIQENFPFSAAAKTIEPTTSFIQSGIIDSTGILEIIGFLEEHYSIKIKDNEIIPENLDTLENISQYICKKIIPGQ